MASLWAEYNAEQDGTVVIERDYGFIQYYFQGDACIVEEMYVKPALRKQGMGTELFRMVCGEAIAAGKKVIVAELNVEWKSCTVALKAQLAAGFVPIAADAGRIVMKYDLGGARG